MTNRYKGFLRTGSGSDEVEVLFGDEVSEITIRRHWMGTGLKRYKLTCRDQPLSSNYGVVVVERIESAAGADSHFEVAEVEEIEGDELLLPLVIEYVTVPRSLVFIHGQSQLTMMRPLGYATGNDHFQLVLMIYDHEGRPQKSPLTDICDALDKKKLALWSDEAEAAQSAQECAESEAARQQWTSILTRK
jgi:hypothetical protein